MFDHYKSWLRKDLKNWQVNMIISVLVGSEILIKTAITITVVFWAGVFMFVALQIV